MAKRSQGLNVYKQLAKQQAKGGGPSTLPTYMDGEIYRCGDEVLEGPVSYYRPARDTEDTRVDKWRLVVVTRDGRTVPVEPSKTRAVKRKEQPSE